MEDSTTEMGLATCCSCGKTGIDVNNILILNFEGPVPGHGWGCVECGLEPNGAVAIQCNECFDKKAKLLNVFNGFPDEGLFPIDQLEKKPHHHILAKHPEFDQTKCRVCGCDVLNPCIDKDGTPCHWVEMDLCSACPQRE